MTRQQSPCPLGNFTRLGLYWNVRGRPSIQSLQNQRNHHEAALVCWGHLERRAFTLRHRAVTPQTPLQFHTMRNNARQTQPVPPHSSYRWSATNPVLVVTAIPGDMRLWTSRMAEFDTSDAK